MKYPYVSMSFRKAAAAILALSVSASCLVPDSAAQLAGRKIGIDPGHGQGVNPGVVIAEGTWVLDAGLRARGHLQANGATVVMTRTTGSDPSLSNRVNILNSNNVHRAVSIHSNAASAAAVGMEAYWCSQGGGPSASQTLADRLRIRSLNMVHNQNRGTKECLDAGRGIHFTIIRNTTMPASLPEYYFHTNSWENNNIHNTTSGRENVARSLVMAIGDVYGVTPTFGATVVTVDNHQSGFSASSNWNTSTWGTEKLGADYRWRSTQPISDAATWTANLPSSGSWRVDALWTAGTNRSTTAPYIVHHSGGSTVVNRNQQGSGGTWVSLGTYNFSSGQQQVQLSCWTTEGFVVIADGVRWVRQ